MAGQRPDGSRRAQILDAAAWVIAERGFCATRLADVAARAGLSAPLAVYYFGSREQLLVEALRYTEDRFYEVVQARLTAATTAREKLAQLLLVCCSSEPVMGLPQGWALWFELWSQAARNTEAADNRAALDDRWQQTVAGVVRDGQSAGEFTAAIDADDVSRMLTAMLDGLAVQIALADPVVTPAVALRLATRFCSTILEVEPALDANRAGS